MALVCLCHGVNTRRIKDEIARGAGSVEEVGRACSAGTCCQSCHPTIEALIEEHEAATAPAFSAVRIGRRRTRFATT